MAHMYLMMYVPNDARNLTMHVNRSRCIYVPNDARNLTMHVNRSKQEQNRKIIKFEYYLYYKFYMLIIHSESFLH